jgi:hypothetical protein
MNGISDIFVLSFVYFAIYIFERSQAVLLDSKNKEILKLDQVIKNKDAIIADLRHIILQNDM